jgi:hypothetical protein
MNLSRPARLMAGVTLPTVPTIVYGGLTVLSVVTAGAHGLSPSVHRNFKRSLEACGKPTEA